MPCLGTTINAAAIIAGCGIGLIFKKLISDKLNAALMQALALCTMAVGLLGVFQDGMTIAEGALTQQHTLVMILSMVLGTIVGEAIDIDRRLESLGDRLSAKFSSGSGSFSQGFVTATLTVCVGAMAIVGSLADGLRHDPSILITKSILDFVICIIFASTLGLGAMFSAVPLLLYQGGITLFASFLKPLLTEAGIAQMGFIGSLLIVGIGFNFVYKPRLRLANMLPAVFMPLLWHGITTIF